MTNTQPDVMLQCYSFNNSAKVTDHLLYIVDGSLKNWQEDQLRISESCFVGVAMKLKVDTPRFKDFVSQ